MFHEYVQIKFILNMLKLKTQNFTKLKLQKLRCSPLITQLCSNGDHR